MLPLVTTLSWQFGQCSGCFNLGASADGCAFSADNNNNFIQNGGELPGLALCHRSFHTQQPDWSEVAMSFQCNRLGLRAMRRLS